MKTLKSLLIVVAGVAAMALAAEKVSVADLIKEGDNYDKKAVKVIAKVNEYKPRKSRAGNEYWTMRIVSGDQTVNVYGRGKLDPAPKTGDSVEVTGMFRKEKKVNDNFTVKNEIDTTVDKEDKKTKDFGVKIKS
jgi:hypothetical protein